MKDFIDRIPLKPNRYKLTTDTGVESFATITREDSPATEGTPLNREAFMALQGMEPCTTTFEADGSISEVYDTGTLTTSFTPSGDVLEAFVSKDLRTVVKRTTFNADGSISEVIA